MGKKWNALREMKELNETKNGKGRDGKPQEGVPQDDAPHSEGTRGDPDDVYRTLGNMLRFWKFCQRRQCKRAQRCSGPVEPCFRHFWPQVPDDIKNEIRFAMKLRAAGASPADAVRGAREELARWKQMEADRAARFARPPAVARTPFVPPRVREL